MNNVIEMRSRHLQKIYKDLAPAARAFLKKQGCSDADSEDFLQEAFLHLWSKQRFIPDGMEMAYLHRMLKNLIIDEFRRTKAKNNYLRCLDETAYEIAAPDEQPAHEARQLLWEKLSEASRDPRASAFILQVRQGLTLEQIAEQEHSSVGTVAAQISRYRKQFKNNLQRAWECSVWC
ncbi:MAG TPA: RNA polymerase sigma factor [Oligoflexus sp.]|uniref:RNA polymerase sigma factor n=1 Tax=Oligoflexus sp. TaxID=1971216 RepID=UPI002D37BBB8|nr:RNA polymerase sigma factor [Oligoflexus sp.]HYX39042.1 RNA polymerase sigma factor [Oligoflexus sp.]